jgi:hypothetical protein
MWPPTFLIPTRPPVTLLKNDMPARGACVLWLAPDPVAALATLTRFSKPIRKSVDWNIVLYDILMAEVPIYAEGTAYCLVCSGMSLSAGSPTNRFFRQTPYRLHA